MFNPQQFLKTHFKKTLIANGTASMHHSILSEAKSRTEQSLPRTESYRSGKSGTASQ